VGLSPDLRAYIHDIVIFLRTHRTLALSPDERDGLPGPGVSALATRHLHVLSRALSALHGLQYVTPSLVDLAVRKIYPHRLRICAAERDRALMYGGDVRSTREWLEGVGVEDVIEEVLTAVEAPL
jgi:MoxR-like ATPase